jgi:hypothetical protein
METVQWAANEILKYEAEITVDPTTAYIVPVIQSAATFFVLDKGRYERLKQIYKHKGVHVSNWEGEVKKRAMELERERRLTLAQAAKAERLGETPPPWDQPVDLRKLLDALTDQVKTYCILPAHVPETVALWIFHTYVLDATHVTPRLAITSPTEECGKSLLLDTLSKLCLRARLIVEPTAAAIFTAIDAEQPTLLVDEGDQPGGRGVDQLLRKVVNAGHRRGLTVARKGISYETFAPVAVASIGRQTRTWESRAIKFLVQRAKSSEKTLIQEWTQETHNSPNWLELSRKCARAANDQLDAIKAAMQKVEFPQELSGRQRDNWRILLAIADVAGTFWALLARDASMALSRNARPQADGILLLKDMMKLVDTLCPGGEAVMFSRDLEIGLRHLENREWEPKAAITMNLVARELSAFGVRPQSVRVGSRHGSGYLLVHLVDLWLRYTDPPANFSSNKLGGEFEPLTTLTVAHEIKN